jgi:hypothetical protein
MSAFVCVRKIRLNSQQACLKLSKVSALRIAPAMMTLMVGRRSKSMRIVATNAFEATLSYVCDEGVSSALWHQCTVWFTNDICTDHCVVGVLFTIILHP